ncbi:MAG: uridine diphosphate-N-acetylglucosamine-binding protein YvcK [Nanoarchaeota archaeon]
MRNNVKAIIFDLDNTLYDNEFLTESVLDKVVSLMIEKGMKCNIEEGINRFKEIINLNPNSNKIKELAESFGCYDENIINAGNDIYRNPDFEELVIYSDTKEVLEKLKGNYKLILISQGNFESQNKRIDILGIRDYFDEILLSNHGMKKENFEKILNKSGFKPNQILVVGDRIDNEIKIGNELGMKTCRIMKGKYKILNPKIKIEESEYNINSLRGLYKILNLKNEKLKIVIIGGGTGTSALLEGLKKYTDNLTAIVNVTDTGRSSGLIRKDFNILAPGDARNCLIALSNSEKLMCDLFQYRISNGNLNGYSFGNLFIAALADLTGSFENAIEEASKILKLKGRVLPSTFDNINICAELEDGTILKEENEIIDRNNDKVYIRSPIKKVFHNPIAKANKRTLEAIHEADLIVLSPGSLYTSVISNLLVEGISEAITVSKAKKVYICNIMTQVSQTYEYKASDHVKKILEYLKSDLDFVILNNKNPSKDLIELYKIENAYLVENDINKIESLGIKVILGDLLDDVKEKKLLWEKKNLLRHDPDKIAEILIGLI